MPKTRRLCYTHEQHRKYHFTPVPNDTSWRSLVYDVLESRIDGEGGHLMKSTLTWGILGTGRIARRFAQELPFSETGRLLAVGSRTQAAADQFVKATNCGRAYGSYDALLADPDVTAIYIALPNHLHAQWAIRCAEAGKHILCEKPLTANHPEAMTVIEAARANDCFLMEAFMYRCHPQIANCSRSFAPARSARCG